MTPPTEPPANPSPQMVELVERVLNHEASLEDMQQLNEALPKDPDLVRYFVEQRLLHGALEAEFGKQSAALDAISDRMISFPGNGPATSQAAPPRSRSKLALVAALTLLAGISAFWGVSKMLYRPAFEVVAHYDTGRGEAPDRGDWVKTRQSIELSKGVVELRSADGNHFTFQGPGTLKIHNAQELTLHSGKLWADLDGEPIQIHAPRGRITDLGTTFGLDASEREFTRVDVFDGKVRFSHATNPQGVAEAGQGESLTSEGDVWNPERGEADASRYAAGLREPLGFSFAQDEQEAQRIRASRAYQARWSAANSRTGSMQLRGSPVEIAWAGSGIFSSGISRSPEAEVFHTHLLAAAWQDNGPMEQQIIEAAARKFGLPDREVGSVIQLRNLDAWRESMGAKALRIMVLRNSQIEGVRFRPIQVLDGSSGQLLATMTHEPSEYRSAGYPDQENTVGARTLKRFDQSFHADSLMLRVEPVEQERLESNTRGNISAVILEPVF